MPVHFHIGASLTTMNYFGTYPWPSHDDDTKLAIGGTLLFIGNAACRRQHHLLRHARPLPRAEDRVGRERDRLDPVHPRGARLRDVGERAASEGRALAHCRRSTSSARSTRRRGSSAPNLAAAHRLGRRGQHHVRDRLPAPDVPLSRPAEHRGREHAPSSAPTAQRKILGENAAKLYRLSPG